MSDDWPETPPERRLRARLLDGTLVDYKDLRPGDVFRVIDVDGNVVHAFTEELEDAVFKCLSEPFPNVERGEGWAFWCDAIEAADVPKELN